ncbi:N-acetylglucosamine-6-phosphate deacetylase [Neorhizobium galegae]|uniref:N-acetylglucosamine-6-phosphate deacetylase n=1 Tax=Neorhizobium galegae TaxID=399 RepID=UPI00062146A3|nr:N-acetylglucosamine-6-phosphate deacetylase [Neorhizobium galegae]MCQ1767142.1 N-acetylglucosamine-6-phosphate deacetylase [Neorhizobium galegae]MCQ1846914.1 N-acetylglucosamine-6-phosphate deacetylase [Neorhizobium galegae]CDZ41813.1 N-acetylglucosamine-6-phosphate deacetylase [Neorhizobium galegae bv. officinalis]
MSTRKAITGARIFDGTFWHDDAVLVFAGGKIEAIQSTSKLPEGIERIDAGGGLIVPGFIDLQVNGGGGVLLNEEPTVAGLRQICAAHAKFGTTALLPTLITDTYEITSRTVEAGKQAKAEGVPGFLGLHLEGPHLSVARKGAHDPKLIRPMEEKDIELMLSCKGVFDAMMITIAPENVTAEQVARLAQAGFMVSLGHTDTTYETAKTYAEAGVRTVTHLFNAMSPLGHRQPGVVGAALDIGSLHVGIIADGIHVHPAAMGVALRSKNGPGKIFIVTDAMSTIGTDMKSFTLNGREILRQDGRLTLADGTLAGADIDMISSVRFAHEAIDLPVEEALRMASTYPAEAAYLADRKGALKPGFDADFVILTNELGMKSTWIGGAKVHQE